MNSVERVKTICKARKIPIYRLEKDLGYANGYIGQLRKGTFPDNRLVEIATYLSVPVSELTGEVEEKEKSPTPEGVEQIPGYEDLSEENKAKARDFIAFLLSQQ